MRLGLARCRRESPCRNLLHLSWLKALRQRNLSVLDIGLARQDPRTPGGRNTGQRQDTAHGCLGRQTMGEPA